MYIVQWPVASKKMLDRRLKTFGRNFEVKSLAVQAGMNDAQWATASAQFRRLFLADPAIYFRDENEMTNFLAVSR